MIDKTLIIKWLREESTEGSELEEIKHENADWIIVAQIEKFPTLFIMPKDKSYLQIQRGIILADSQIKLLKKMRSKRRSQFYYTLKKSILMTKVRYTLIFPPDAPSILHEIKLLSRVYEDSLNQDNFIQVLFDVHNTTVLMVNEINYHIGD